MGKSLSQRTARVLTTQTRIRKTGLQPVHDSAAPGQGGDDRLHASSRSGGRTPREYARWVPLLLQRCATLRPPPDTAEFPPEEGSGLTSAQPFLSTGRKSTWRRRQPWTGA